MFGTLFAQAVVYFGVGKQLMTEATQIAGRRYIKSVTALIFEAKTFEDGADS